MASSTNNPIPTFEAIRTCTLEKLGVSPCLWQCNVTKSVLEALNDVVSVAPTGGGKTMTFWMPLLFRPEGIVVVITPLNILGSQVRVCAQRCEELPGFQSEVVGE